MSKSKRIIREPERLHRTGISRVQWWRMERDGRAPKRVRLGPVACGWIEAEIENWVDNLAAERDRTEAA